MNHTTATLPRPAVPAEVEEFATNRGVSAWLPAVINLAQQAFPTSALLVSVGQDAEDETHRYIALDVDTADLSADELLTSQQAWSAGLRRVCPSRHAVHFVLGWR